MAFIDATCSLSNMYIGDGDECYVIPIVLNMAFGSDREPNYLASPICVPTKGIYDGKGVKIHLAYIDFTERYPIGNDYFSLARVDVYDYLKDLHRTDYFKIDPYFPLKDQIKANHSFYVEREYFIQYIEIYKDNQDENIVLLNDLFNVMLNLRNLRRYLLPLGSVGDQFGTTNIPLQREYMDFLKTIE